MDNGRHERESAPPSALDSRPSRPAADHLRTIQWWWWWITRGSYPNHW